MAESFQGGADFVRHSSSVTAFDLDDDPPPSPPAILRESSAISAISLEDVSPEQDVATGTGKSGASHKSSRVRSLELDTHGQDSDMPAELEDYMDWALARVDDWGTFQRRGVALMSLCQGLVGMQALAHLFVSLPPQLRRICTNQLGPCGTDVIFEVDCAWDDEEYEFVASDSSIISDFDLVCESAYMAPMLGTLFFFGFLLGVTVLGTFADQRGRRPAYIGSVVVMQVGALLAVIAPTYAVYAMARVVIGFGVGGLGLVSYVWSAEIVGAETRPLLIIMQSGGFAIGVMLLSPLAYPIPHWRWFLLVCFLLGMPLVCFQGWFLESPKWLAGPVQRLDDAHAALCHIAMINGRCPPPSPPLPRANTRCRTGTDPEQSIFYLLLCDARLSYRFAVMCFAWFALSLGYYGVSMNASNIGLSVYVSSAILAFVELPTYPLAIWLVEASRAGRRGTTGGGLALGGACCLLCVMVPSDKPFILISLAFLGKAAIAAAFGVVYLFAAELFPTSIRSRSMSLQSLVARLGGMLAPVVADLGTVSKALPFAIFGAPCLAAGLLLFTLPETAGQPLLGTVEDIKMPSKRPRRPCLWRYRELEEDQDGSPSMQPTTVGASST